MRWLENIFKPSIENVIEQELDHSRRQLLLAESSLDSAKALVEYNKAVIARLEARREQAPAGATRGEQAHAG
jgi:hypothetical protein